MNIMKRIHLKNEKEKGEKTNILLKGGLSKRKKKDWYEWFESLDNGIRIDYYREGNKRFDSEFPKGYQ